MLSYQVTIQNYQTKHIHHYQQRLTGLCSHANTKPELCTNICSMGARLMRVGKGRRSLQCPSISLAHKLSRTVTVAIANVCPGMLMREEMSKQQEDSEQRVTFTAVRSREQKRVKDAIKMPSRCLDLAAPTAAADPDEYLLHQTRLVARLGCLLRCSDAMCLTVVLPWRGV